jgi:hypothetical protein
MPATRRADLAQRHPLQILLTANPARRTVRLPGSPEPLLSESSMGRAVNVLSRRGTGPLSVTV